MWMAHRCVCMRFNTNLFTSSIFGTIPVDVDAVPGTWYHVVPGQFLPLILETDWIIHSSARNRRRWTISR